MAVLAAFTLFFALPLADAAQCLGTTRAGARCKRQTNSASGYCYQHDTGVKHCAGKTKDGLSCRNLPESGSDYCKLHKPASGKSSPTRTNPQPRPITHGTKDYWRN